MITMERPGVMMLVVPLLLLLLVVGEVEPQRSRQRLMGTLLQPLVPIPSVLRHPIVPPPGFLVPGPFPEPVARRRLGTGVVQGAEGLRQTVQQSGFVQTAKPKQQGNFIQKQPRPTQPGDSVQQPRPSHPGDSVQQPRPSHPGDSVQQPRPSHPGDSVQQPRPSQQEGSVQQPRPSQQEGSVQQPRPSQQEGSVQQPRPSQQEGSVQQPRPSQQEGSVQQPRPSHPGGSVQQPRPSQHDEAQSQPVGGGTHVPGVPHVPHFPTSTPAPTPAPAQHAPSPSGHRHHLCGVMPNPGECRAAFPRYYFNETTNQCDCFLYGGCGNEGLQSSYRSLDECHHQCHPENTQEGATCSDIFRDQQTFFGDPVKQTPQRQQQEQQQSRGTVGGVPFPDTTHLNERELLELFMKSKFNLDYDESSEKRFLHV